MAIDYRRCPKCNTTRTGVIHYGEPCIPYPIDDNIRFGGCCYSLDSPINREEDGRLRYAYGIPQLP